jgi:hypothetical protein
MSRKNPLWGSPHMLLSAGDQPWITGLSPAESAMWSQLSLSTDPSGCTSVLAPEMTQFSVGLGCVIPAAPKKIPEMTAFAPAKRVMRNCT